MDFATPPIVIAYLVAAILFILSLRGLSSQETARRGNLYGVIGMAIAVLATLTSGHIAAYEYTLPALGVAVTQMPELVALLHSFVGLAAVLVGYAFFRGGHTGKVLLVEIYVDVFIGALTFTGSVLAFAKLRGTISGR